MEIDVSALTEIIISAQGRGCGQLRMISVSSGVEVTDRGVSALSHGCSQPQNVNLIDVGTSQIQTYQHCAMDVVSFRRSVLLVASKSRA
jgi:hypothetical protein